MKQAWWQYDSKQGLCAYIYICGATLPSCFTKKCMSGTADVSDSERSLMKKTSLLNCKRRLAHKGIQTEVMWWRESEMGRLGTWTVATRVQAVENKGTCYCIEILPRLLWWEYCKHATLAFGDAHITKTKSAIFWRPLSSSKTKLPHPNVVTWVGTHMCTLRQNYTRILSELRSSSDQGSNPLEACSAECSEPARQL